MLNRKAAERKRRGDVRPVDARLSAAFSRSGFCRRQKARILFSVIALAMLLTSCASALPAPSETVAQVIEEGLLTDLNSIRSTSTDYETVEVTYGSLSSSKDTSVRVITPVTRDLYFERDNGRLKALHVKQGDSVKEGDVLAEINFDTDRLEAERSRMALEHGLFERGVVTADAVFIENIAKAQTAVDEAAENDFELQSLALMKLELEYEKFKFDNENTRKQYAKDLAELNEQLTGEQITAPYNGIISYVISARPGDLIRNFSQIVTIVDDSKIQFQMEGPRDVIRYGDEFQVKNKEETIVFTGKVVSDPMAEFNTNAQLDFTLEPTDPGVIQQIIDAGINLTSPGRVVFSGSPLAMAVEDTLVVPRQAVNPENDNNFVYVYEDGILKKRYVTTGLIFADNVQILDGLTAGQSVVISP